MFTSQAVKAVLNYEMGGGENWPSCSVYYFDIKDSVAVVPDKLK